MHHERAAIVGGGCVARGEDRLAHAIADAERRFAARGRKVTKPVPRYIITGAAYCDILQEMDDAEHIDHPRGVQRKIIEAVWRLWRERVPHLTELRVAEAWKLARWVGREWLGWDAGPRWLVD